MKKIMKVTATPYETNYYGTFKKNTTNVIKLSKDLYAYVSDREICIFIDKFKDSKEIKFHSKLTSNSKADSGYIEMTEPTKEEIELYNACSKKVELIQKLKNL